MQFCHCRSQIALAGMVVAKRSLKLATVLLGTLGVAFALLFAQPRACQAAEPPLGSPLANRAHPRLGFTAADLVTLRARIATHYRGEFQAFLDLLADPSKLTVRQKEIENSWGGMNYAFVAALDPAEMQARGFTVASSIDSRAKLCGRAMTYARTMLPSIAAAAAQEHGALNAGYPTSIYFPVALVYDWCHGQLSTAERAEIADAFVAGFAKKYRGKNVATMEITGLAMVANNQSSGNIHDLMGILAFYGDAHPDVSVQQEMYDAFDTMWLRRAVAELEYLYPTGTGWHEGSGGYMSEGFVNLGVPLGLIGPALGRNFFRELPFFHRLAQFGELVVKPMGLSFTCGSGGGDACPTVFERWGTISTGIGRLGCKATRFVSGALAQAGHASAGRTRALWESTFGCTESTVTQYGGAWSNAVLLWFLFGDREVPVVASSQPGLRRSAQLGLGLVGMKSGFGPRDSQVVFFAQEIGTYGHGSPEYGSFTIHKYGNLVLQAANFKSGEGSFTILQSMPPRGVIFENVVSAHKGDTDPGLGFSGTVPADAVFRSTRRVGRTYGLLLNGDDFDYVAYENTPAWGRVATLAQREFVYVRGPENSEYVVVLDRVTTTSPSTDEKIWRIWVPTKPEFVNGVGTAPRPGKWTSASSDTVVLTNRFPRLLGRDFESGPTRGRFFLKTLWPSTPVINFIGGEGMEFQSGDDDGSTPWGAPKMSQAAREYLGWGRVEVRPPVAQADDLFLNVFQFGDADGLTAMADVLRVTSTDNAMVGAHIRDPRNEWVLLFSRAPGGAAGRASASYTYSPGASGSKHLVANLKPGAQVHVVTEPVDAGTRVTVSPTPVPGAIVAQTSEHGVLFFQLIGQTVVPLVAPGAPVNFRLVR